MKLEKDNNEGKKDWPLKKILEVIPITMEQAMHCGLPREVAINNACRFVVLQCGHWTLDVVDGKGVLAVRNYSIGCRNCYHIKLLRDSVIKQQEKMQNALPNEGPEKG